MAGAAPLPDASPHPHPAYLSHQAGGKAQRRHATKGVLPPGKQWLAQTGFKVVAQTAATQRTTAVAGQRAALCLCYAATDRRVKAGTSGEVL